MKVAILGAGSWGTALASVVLENRHQVMLWARNPDVVIGINRFHRSTYFPGVDLAPHLTATDELETALHDAEIIIYAVPSKAIRGTARLAEPLIPKGASVVHAAKGFDLPSLRRMSEVLCEENPRQRHRIGVIAGPSHAEEVIRQLPTAIVSASSSKAVALDIQSILMNRYIRVYTQSDVIGVELGGSLKNIIALGVGIVDGLGFGDNAKAAIMTRGLAEISRLGEAMGAHPLTFAGLTGIGDLVATCTSNHSRNLRAGRLIGKGMSAVAAEREIGMVVEGIPAVDAALQLSIQQGVEMPITHALHRVLHEGLMPADALEELMGRAKREEAKVEDNGPFW